MSVKTEDLLKLKDHFKNNYQLDNKKENNTKKLNKNTKNK